MDYQNTLKSDFITKDINKSDKFQNITLSSESKIDIINYIDNIDNTANLNYTHQDVVSSIFFENFKSNNYHYKGTQEKTSIIPNLLYRKNKIKEDNEEKNPFKAEKMSALYYLFKDILYILSPLIIIIIIILLIIKCKQNTHILRNKYLVFNNSYKNSRQVETCSDFLASNSNFNLNDIIVRRDSIKYINLTNIETADNWLDERSKMITNV